MSASSVGGYDMKTDQADNWLIGIAVYYWNDR
jgi:hypothetical protein